MCEGFDFCTVHFSVQIQALGFFSKDNRYVEILGCNAGNADTGSLNGENLGDRCVGVNSFELFSYLINKGNIHLMIEKTVYFRRIFPVLQFHLLKCVPLKAAFVIPPVFSINTIIRYISRIGNLFFAFFLKSVQEVDFRLWYGVKWSNKVKLFRRKIRIQNTRSFGRCLIFVPEIR